VTRRRLDGLLLLDKPRGVTSNTALQRAKRLYRAEKAGHAGTLDPLASGLLPILFGEATKFSGLLLDAEKTYEAAVQLGTGTSTGDAEGEVIERGAVEADAARLEHALAQFRGAIDQVPPMHSALKQGGRPLYELAREGVVVERAPRRVVISELTLLERRDTLLFLRVQCSKGTYIRSLAADLGHALGTCAHLAALRRTGAGGFTIGAATPLEVIELLDDAGRDRLLLPLKTLFAGLAEVVLDSPRASRFAQGQSTPVPAQGPGRCQVLDARGGLIGLGECGADGVLRPVRLLALPKASCATAQESQKTL
jgi:tRNA pseudouridine55 synthase